MLDATVIICLLCDSLWLVKSYTVPTPQISVLLPRGLRFEIVDPTPGVRLIAYHYSVNADVPGVQAGQYNVDVLPQGGLFVNENRLVTVNDGDTVHYWVNAIYDNNVTVLDYQLLDQQWTYNAALVDTSPQPTPTPRRPSLPTRIPQTLYSSLGVTSAMTPTPRANNLSTVATPADSGGLTATNTIILAVTIVCAVALAVSLAIFFTCRSKRTDRTIKSQPPKLGSRPRPPPPLPPPRQAELVYEDPDELSTGGSSRRGVAREDSWPGPAAAAKPSAAAAQAARARAPIPSSPPPPQHEFCPLAAPSARESYGGYFTPVA